MIIECVICYEHLQSSEAIYHTPCGHVFHQSCLTLWMERSKTCPECREKVSETALKRIYLHFSPDSSDDLSTGLGLVQELREKARIKELELIESNSNNARLTALLKLAKSQLVDFRVLLLQVWTAEAEVARLTKERDESINLKTQWEELSRMFHGIKEPWLLLAEISMMKNRLGTCEADRLELQSTVTKLQQQIQEATCSRDYVNSEPAKMRQMENSLATLEIEKIVLQKRIDDLEAMLITDRKSERNSDISIEEADAFISVPAKKIKLHTTTDCINGSAGGPIGVIDLTEEVVQPLIDLTETDTVDLHENEIELS